MAKHNWPQLKREFLSGRWITLEAMALETGIRPSFLRAKAAKDKWSEQRTVLEREIEAKSMARLTERLAREAEKRIPGWLDMADALKFKALQALTAETMRLTGQEAIRAMEAAVGIESRLLTPKGAQDGDSEQRGPRLAFTQINLTAGPAQLPAPAAFTEATDAQLISLIGKAPLGARVVEAKNPSKPGRRRGRAAKAPKRSKAVSKLRPIHVQKIRGKLAP